MGINAIGLFGGAAAPNERTSLLQNLAIGTDIAPHVVCHPGGTVALAVGVLRKAIASDLVVTLNVVTASGSTLIGTFTIPHATAINTPVSFTTFSHAALNDLDVLSWNITGSDGSSDPNGVASFSVYWS